MLIDASPLIYLAKLEAFDVFEKSGHIPLVTPMVERETARPGLGYEYPDSLVIANALRSGNLKRTDLTPVEQQLANRLQTESGGIDAGEAEVLAAAVERKLPALLYERRAMRLARSMGVDAWTPVRLFFAGTPDATVLSHRVSGFAGLVQMRFRDVQVLMELIEAEK